MEQLQHPPTANFHESAVKGFILLSYALVEDVIDIQIDVFLSIKFKILCSENSNQCLFLCLEVANKGKYIVNSSIVWQKW